MNFISQNQRLLARLRACAPGLFFLPGFVCGQLTAHFLGWCSLIFFLVLLVYLCNLRWPWAKSLRAKLRQSSIFGMLLWSFLPGVLTMLSIQDIKPTTKLESGQSYLAYVDENPRYRKPGAKELSLLIVAKLNAAKKKEFVPLSNPVPTIARAIDLPWRNVGQSDRGSYLAIVGEFKPIKLGINPFSWESTSYRRGYRAECKLRYASTLILDSDSTLERLQGGIARSVKQVLGNSERAGLLLSMSIGTRDVLSPQTERAFKQTGLAHLLVASGYQVTLFYYLVFYIARWLLTRSSRLCLLFPVKFVASLLALAGGLAFVVVAGVEGSSARAALSLLFVVTAMTLERRGGLGGSIVVSLILLSVIWPGAYLEPGVELTYAALFGIFLGARAAGGRLMEYLRVCFYASLCTSLVVVIWFQNLSLIGFLLNPLAAPLLSFVGCYGGFLAMAVYFMGIDKEGLLLQGVSYLLMLSRDAIWYLARLNWGFEKMDILTSALIAALLFMLIVLIVARSLLDFKLAFNLLAVGTGNNSLVNEKSTRYAAREFSSD